MVERPSLRRPVLLTTRDARAACCRAFFFAAPAALLLAGCEGLDSFYAATDPEPVTVSDSPVLLQRGAFQDLKRTYQGTTSFRTRGPDPHVLLWPETHNKSCDAGPGQLLFASAYGQEVLVVQHLDPDGTTGTNDVSHHALHGTSNSMRGDVRFVDGRCQEVYPTLKNAQLVTFVASSDPSHGIVDDKGDYYWFWRETAELRHVASEIAEISVRPFTVVDRRGQLVQLKRSQTEPLTHTPIASSVTRVVANYFQWAAEGPDGVFARGDRHWANACNVSLASGSAAYLSGSVVFEEPCGSGRYYWGDHELPEGVNEIVAGETSEGMVTVISAKTSPAGAGAYRYWTHPQEPFATGVSCVSGSFLCVADVENTRALILISSDPSSEPFEVLARDVHAADLTSRSTGSPNYLCGPEAGDAQALIIQDFDGEVGDLVCHVETRDGVESFLVAKNVSSLPAAPTELNPNFTVASPSPALIPLVIGPNKGGGELRVTTLEPGGPVLPLPEDAPTVARGVSPGQVKAFWGLEAVAYLRQGKERALRVAVLPSEIDIHIHDQVSEFVPMDFPEGLLFIVEEGPDQGLWVARAK